MKRARPTGLLLVIALAGCSLHQQASPSAPPATLPATATGPRSKISHVVIIVQENRSVDNLFHGLPGADTADYGLQSNGKEVRLEPVSLTGPYDVSHRHVAFETEYADGRLDGFNLVQSHCSHRGRCPRAGVRAYAYVPRSQIQPYFAMAEKYAFADRMFQSNEGPSFPAHQYLISGTSTIAPGSALRASENPQTRSGIYTGGCDSPEGTRVPLIDSSGNEDRRVYPCFDRPALTDLVEARSLTWRYYQGHLGPGLWNGPDAIAHIRYGADYREHVSAPPSAVIGDIDAGRLANVVWVTPTLPDSDHPGSKGTGPSWVASIVNAIGNSSYWSNTAIFVVWDDWGGWYDHVKPPQYNSYELGFRVPLIAISPYAKSGYVSHKKHEFGSILKFVEETFGLGSLGTTDQRSDDLSDCFNFSRAPQAFKTIPTRLSGSYFVHEPPSSADPDDDF